LFNGSVRDYWENRRKWLVWGCIGAHSHLKEKQLSFLWFDNWALLQSA